MKKIILAIVVAYLFADNAHATSDLPEGAKALGYTRQVFYNEPQVEQVSQTGTDSTSIWYPGMYYKPLDQNLNTLQYLRTYKGHLSIQWRGGISSQTYYSKQAVLPFLSGADGFYVEFAIRVSNNNIDHWTALWLLANEHDLAKTDVLPGSPAGYEHWTELDVSESNMDQSGGSLESLIDWQGKYPDYQSHKQNSYGHTPRLDWTRPHSFGMSWDPVGNTLQFYRDNKPTWSTQPNSDSTIRNWHYYLIINSQDHGQDKPYAMRVRYVAAYAK